MATDARQKFTVITNHELEEKDKKRTYQSNPISDNPLREKFMKYVNNEAGKRFTVEDLLNW